MKHLKMHSVLNLLNPHSPFQCKQRMNPLCCLLEVKPRAQLAEHSHFHDPLRCGAWEAVAQSVFAFGSLQCLTRGAVLGALESNVLSFSLRKFMQKYIKITWGKISQHLQG